MQSPIHDSTFTLLPWNAVKAKPKMGAAWLILKYVIVYTLTITITP